MTISIADNAQSYPLFPALLPARAIACSIFSVVITPNNTGTPVSRADAIKYQKSKIASLKLDLQESDIKISQLEKKANKKLITAKLDGTVTYVGDSGSGETTDGKALIKIKSSDGFYVVGSVSELMLDDFKEGTKLNCTSYTSGFF